VELIKFACTLGHQTWILIYSKKKHGF